MAKKKKPIREQTVALMDKVQKNLYKIFPSSSWLASPSHMEAFLCANTFYRRNPHRFVKDYLGIKLHLYQIVLLYLMFCSDTIALIAARSTAKSFIIAIYAVVKCILWPNSWVVLTSGTRGQAALIVRRKIERELMRMSPNLRREIKAVRGSGEEAVVVFRNDSTITTVTLGSSGLGNRSTDTVAEEAKTCDKDELDKVAKPFRIARQIPFNKIAPYEGDMRFIEEPKEIYLSSSIEETHWLYKMAVNYRDGMFKGDGAFFIAFDYSLTLRHNIKTRKALMADRRDMDPLTWAIEYENAVLRTNTKAFFTYDILKQNQVMRRAFLPRRHDDFRANTKNPFSMKKLPGEIRIVSADIAAIDKVANDNSCYSCLRVFPEIVEYGGKKSSDVRISVPYLEAMRGCEFRRQAIRIRQLFADFEADYIVLDVRNVGLSVLDYLSRPLYDEDRSIEYAPFAAMNDDVLASRIYQENAQKVIFCVTGAPKLNSEIATNMKSYLTSRRIDLLVPKEAGIDEMYKALPSRPAEFSPEERVLYERPYLETMLLITEMMNLEYEKAENTGLIKLREKATGTKDRYTSVSYGAFFADQLGRDMLGDDGMDFESAPMCVTSVEL